LLTPGSLEQATGRMREALVALGRRASEGSFVIFIGIHRCVDTMIGVNNGEKSRDEEAEDEEQHLRVSGRTFYSGS